MGENIMMNCTNSGDKPCLAITQAQQMDDVVHQMQAALDYLKSISVFCRYVEKDKREEFWSIFDKHGDFMSGRIVGIEASTPPLKGAMQEVWENAKPFSILEEPIYECCWGDRITIIFCVAGCVIDYFVYDGSVDWTLLVEMLDFIQMVEAMIDMEANRFKFNRHYVWFHYHLQYDKKSYAPLKDLTIRVSVEEDGASEFKKFDGKTLNLDTRNAIMNTLERYEAIRMMKELEPQLRRHQITYKCKVKNEEPADDKNKKAHPYSYADGEDSSLLYFVWDINGERRTCHPDMNGVKLMQKIITEKQSQGREGIEQYNSTDCEKQGFCYDPRYPEDDPDFGRGSDSDEQPHGFFARIAAFFRNLGHKS